MSFASKQHLNWPGFSSRDGQSVTCDYLLALRAPIAPPEDAMNDPLHRRPDGTASWTFRENRNRFVEGEDYSNVKLDVFRRGFQDATPHPWLVATSPSSSPRLGPCAGPRFGFLLRDPDQVGEHSQSGELGTGGEHEQVAGDVVGRFGRFG